MNPGRKVPASRLLIRISTTSSMPAIGSFDRLNADAEFNRRRTKNAACDVIVLNAVFDPRKNSSNACLVDACCEAVDSPEFFHEFFKCDLTGGRSLTQTSQILHLFQPVAGAIVIIRRRQRLTNSASYILPT
jgi:hypothetical protein